MKELHVKQLQEDKLDTRKAKVKQADGTAYEFIKEEGHLVHAEISTPQFDPVTGLDKSIRFVQKFYPDEFKRTVDSNGFAGRKVTVLHDGSSEGTAEDVEPTEHLNPKIVSEPGAGTPLDLNVDEASNEDVNWLYEKLFEGQTAVRGTATTRDQKVAEIKARHGFLRDARVQREFVNRANNMLGTSDAAAMMQNLDTSAPGTASVTPAAPPLSDVQKAHEVQNADKKGGEKK